MKLPHAKYRPLTFFALLVLTFLSDAMLIKTTSEIPTQINVKNAVSEVVKDTTKIIALHSKLVNVSQQLAEHLDAPPPQQFVALAAPPSRASADGSIKDAPATNRIKDWSVIFLTVNNRAPVVMLNGQVVHLGDKLADGSVVRKINSSNIVISTTEGEILRIRKRDSYS